jgi:hypothetical protein
MCHVVDKPMIMLLIIWYILAAPSGHAVSNWKSLACMFWKNCSNSCKQWDRRPLAANWRHKSVALMGLMPGFGALEILPPARWVRYFSGRYPVCYWKNPKFGDVMEEGGVIENVTPHFPAVPSPLVDCCSALRAKKKFARGLIVRWNRNCCLLSPRIGPTRGWRPGALQSVHSHWISGEPQRISYENEKWYILTGNQLEHAGNWLQSHNDCFID